VLKFRVFLAVNVRIIEKFNYRLHADHELFRRCGISVIVLRILHPVTNPSVLAQHA